VKEDQIVDFPDICKVLSKHKVDFIKETITEKDKAVLPILQRTLEETIKKDE